MNSSRPRSRIHALLSSLALFVTFAPDIPVPRTAGEPELYSASYMQLRADYTATRSLAFAIETDYYRVAPVIRQAGGHDSLYGAIEGRWDW